MTMRYLVSVFILMCCAAVAVPTGEQAGSAQSALESARKTAVVDGNLPAAIKQYQAIAERYAKTDRAAAAEALLRMADAYRMLGDAQARTTYERIVREYSDQVDPVAAARGRLAALKGAQATNTTSLGLVCADCGDPEASISRDGQWQVVTDWGTGDLSIRDLATGQTRRLFVKAGTYKDSDEYAQVPVFSPDASQIAYVWDPGKNGVPPQLRVVANRVGGKARVLLDKEFEWLSPLAWSPDGRRVLAALEKPDKTWQLAWVSTTDGAVTILKSLDWRLTGVRDATPSPDGRFIAYSARARNPERAPTGAERELGEWHIYVLSADGRTETEVTRTAGIDKEPMWSPDGSHLLFRSDRSGTVDLWALPMREGKAIGPAFVVRRDIGVASNLGITNTGAYHFVRVVRGLQQVFVAELDTTGKLPANVRIVDSFAGMNPSWSPDGKLLEFAKSAPLADGITFNLIVRNMATSEEKLVSRPGLRNGPGRWLSNTAFLQLVVRSARSAGEGYRSVYSLDLLQGTSREVLPEDSSRSGAAAVSPDGSTLYQFARDPETPATSPFTRIVAVDLATAQERLVVRLTGPADTLPVAAGVTLSVSPDGRTLAVATRNRKTGDVRLWRVGIDGTQSREVYGPFPFWPGLADRIAWTKDGRGILFPTVEGRQWKIMRVSPEGGQPEFTGLEVRDLGPFSVSPDGSRIAYTSTSANQSELWALDVSWVWTGKR